MLAFAIHYCGMVVAVVVVVVVVGWIILSNTIDIHRCFPPNLISAESEVDGLLDLGPRISTWLVP